MIPDLILNVQLELEDKNRRKDTWIDFFGDLASTRQGLMINN